MTGLSSTDPLAARDASTLRSLSDTPTTHEMDDSPTVPLLQDYQRSSISSEQSVRQDITDNEAGKRTLAKIDRTIIPLLFITYMFNFMDKVILSSAAVFGLIEDTVCLSIQHLYIGTDAI
jgi:hypothetical protein